MSGRIFSRQTVLAAFDEVGGKNHLVRIAQDDPKTFCTLLARLVPTQLRAELNGTDTVVAIRDYTGRTPKEDSDSAGPPPTPLLESGLEPEPAKPTTWAIRRLDADEREAGALL